MLFTHKQKKKCFHKYIFCLQGDVTEPPMSREQIKGLRCSQDLIFSIVGAFTTRSLSSHTMSVKPAA